MAGKQLKELNMENMQKAISDAGGLFYQYRPCRRNAATIYDIENIRHGVVYAQTPLNMNDPFDSMVGFSAEKIYVNCISMLVEALGVTGTVKIIVSALLRYRAFGKMAELMTLLKSLKDYLSIRRSLMHETHIPLERFVKQNATVLFSKLPKALKDKLNSESFIAFSTIVGKLGSMEITESNIISLMDLDAELDKLHKLAEEIRDNKYLPAIRELLSKLTVSCFSVSGWDNQLMWSHYANSYAGICVEYDFTKINDFIGFIYPVAYSSTRPTLSLQDLGIGGFDFENKDLVRCEVDMTSVFEYLLSKNTCWSYEKEWRIIDIGEPDTPKFFDLPFVKSITFGLNVDPLCKRLLWDVSKEKGIDCYEIMLNSENYDLDRKLLGECDFAFDSDIEVEYINILCQQLGDSAKRVESLVVPFENNSKDMSIDFSCMRLILAEAIDMVSNAYFIKASLNRLCENANEDLSLLRIPEDFLNGISQIDSFISILAQSIGEIEKSIPTLRIFGKLNRVDYPVIQTQIQNLKELIDRYRIRNWCPICVKANNSEQAER